MFGPSYFVTALIAHLCLKDAHFCSIWFIAILRCGRLQLNFKQKDSLFLSNHVHCVDIVCIIDYCSQKYYELFNVWHFFPLLICWVWHCVCRIFLNLIIVRRNKKKCEKEASNSACFECHDKLRNARNFQHVRPLSAPNRREGG